MFITFEGVDGSGKTTQAQRTAAYLKQCGYDVLYTREPGGTFIGDQVRAVLLDNMENTAMHARTELLLFCASRAQLVAELINPHLERGGIVVCDRYVDSTVAYQGYGHGLNLKMLRHVLNFATGGLLPDVTLYLEITPEDALKRRAEATLFGADWNRLDDMDLEFHRRVYKGYRELLLAEPARFVEIDAIGTPVAVQGAIRKALSEWLELPRIPHENGHNSPRGQSKQ
jgi:dTMP kinase